VFVFNSMSVLFLYNLEPCKDCKNYFLMSEGRYDEVAPGFRNRVLTPFLAGLLPFSPTINFFIFNFPVMVLASYLFYFFLRRLKYSMHLSLIGSFILIGSHTIISIGWTVDALFFFFLILGFFAILIKNDLLYFFSLLLGVLNKEIILLLIPLYLIMNKDIWKTFYLSIVPVLIEAKLYFRPELMAHRSESAQRAFQAFFEYFFPHKINSVFVAFNLFWIMALLGFKNAPKFVKKSCLLLPIFFLMVPASLTPDRVVFMAFPIIIPLALQFLKDMGI